MKSLILFLLGCLPALCHAFGVVVIDAQQPALLPPGRSTYEVLVENQVAITRVHSEFLNPLNEDFDPVWAFPLPQDASATRLRYRLNGQWTDVPIALGPQEPGLPGGTQHPTLRAYLGNTPLIFPFAHALLPDSSLVIELDYVELLPYADGTVSLRHPGTLASILPNQIFSVGYHLALSSDRTIASLELTSGHTGESVLFEGGEGTIDWVDPVVYPTEDFTVSYSLDREDLGLFATSTQLPDTLMPEADDPGFLVFIAEPDPDDQQAVMDKVFTLIIDRSGSMAGTKIIQARAAARFIINNLNEGDQFNLISFDTTVLSFQPDHVPYTPANRQAALDWIDDVVEYGWTNISGAFATAIPQFAGTAGNTANIIVFFTDGLPTYGITNPDQLVSYVNSLFDAQEAPISLFCFGIGQDVNRSLLARMASDNLGFAEFLENDELEERISRFYLRVRNPVLMQPTLTAFPPVLHRTAPFELPNLYLGEQMIVAARYDQAVPVTLTLSGTAFGMPVEYDYPVELATGYDEHRAFLTKVWAKRTIESLMVEYYQYPENSPQAQAFEDEITELSLTWGVVSIFTSFNDNVSVSKPEEPARPAALLLVQAYPNPFNPSTTLRITVPAGSPRGPLVVRIYNLQGQLVRTLGILAEGAGVYELVWDGLGEGSRSLASGTYLAIVSAGDRMAAHRLTLLK